MILYIIIVVLVVTLLSLVLSRISIIKKNIENDFYVLFFINIGIMSFFLPFIFFNFGFIVMILLSAVISPLLVFATTLVVKYAKQKGGIKNILIKNGIISRENKNEHNLISAETLTSRNVLRTVDEYSFLENIEHHRSEGELELAIKYCEDIINSEADVDDIFKVVFETCLIYKEIGQEDLAIFILNSYVNEYRDIMEEKLLEDIKKHFDLEVN